MNVGLLKHGSQRTASLVLKKMLQVSTLNINADVALLNSDCLTH